MEVDDDGKAKQQPPLKPMAAAKKEKEGAEGEKARALAAPTSCRGS